MPENSEWKPTACICCNTNCGLEIVVEDGHLKRIRGDKKNPESRGYLCEKAIALDHYQNNSDRLAHPLRRNSNGSFDEVSWETAISEIASKLVNFRDTVGPHSIAFYGGAAQGNHLHLIQSVGLRMALRTPYMYHALGQEKTGEFWLDGELYGSQTCHTTNDIEHSDFVMLSGTNPWQSHGFPRARVVLREISFDPARTLVVIDPRLSETAIIADIHLRVRPGCDAFLLAAMLAVIVEEGLEDRDFIAQRTVGFEPLMQVLKQVPIDKYAKIAGVDPAAVRQVARGFAKARSACVRSELGLEQSYHSTLNLYLEKLMYLLTGNFGKRGGNNFHAQTLPLLRHSDRNAPEWEMLKTRVTGMIPIAGFYPPNILPAEIDSEHPERIQALIVDSANPAVTGADTQAYRRALEKLNLLVVIDTAMTETAEMAHYVLPAPSQFEKYECTFFNWGFPENHLHLRHPVVEPRKGSLAEQEIYRRLLLAMNEDPSKHPIFGPLGQIEAMLEAQGIPLDLRRAAAPIFMACMGFAQQHPAAIQRAGIHENGKGLAVALFERIVSSPSGAVISMHEYEDTFSFLRHADGKIHLSVDLMMQCLDELQQEADHGLVVDKEYPFLLSAGERRSSNATTTYRNPAWRKTDFKGSMVMNPDDAKRLGLSEGDLAECESRQGKISVYVHVDDGIPVGFASVPHGFGLKYAGSDGKRTMHGPPINILTSSLHCDPLTKTPYHKNVPVRIRKAV